MRTGSYLSAPPAGYQKNEENGGINIYRNKNKHLGKTVTLQLLKLISGAVHFFISQCFTCEVRI